MIEISQTSSSSNDDGIAESRCSRTGVPKSAWIQSPGMLFLIGMLVLILQATPSSSFQQQQRFSVMPTTARTPKIVLASSENGNSPKPYVPIKISQPLGKRQKALIPRIGDIVRYYDLDGGEDRGEVLLGKISYVFGSKAYGGYSVELNELEDVGDGYFAEYSSAMQSRKGRKTERRLAEVSPIAASFVGSEQAYKVPIDAITKLPKPRQETYDIDEYEGPAFYANVDENVLETDAENYTTLKLKLLRDVFLTGLVGAIVTNASYGSELAIIYFAGSLASILYLVLLSIKTDTVAVNSEDNTKNLAGTPFANLRFGAPVLVLIGVSIWNTQKMSSGLGESDDFSMRLFDTVTRQQFGATILGFLTYRLPLFVVQIRDAFKAIEAENAGGSDDSSGVQLPGSAGVAAKLLSRGTKSDESDSIAASSDDQVTILIVSGPQASGRPELVESLLKSGDFDLNKLVRPNLVFRNDDGATFERLERRKEFLEVTQDSGLTSDGILDAARGLVDGKEIPNENVVVVDASVELANKLTTSNFGGNTRLICVWIGLNSVKDFEKRLEISINDGTLIVPEDETKESFLRGKIKDIINEIDFGLGSGIFEFTVLNDATDPDKSLKELKEAAMYAFK